MSIDVQQPRPYDLVGDDLRIAGVAGDAFEASFRYRIRDGHAEVAGSFMSGDGAGGHTQFQLTAGLAGAAFAGERLTLEVFHVSPKDGTELDKVTIAVVLGRLIVPGYRNYVEHVVKPGDSLWKIADQYYGSGDLYPRLVAANPGTITDPSVIHPGEVVRVPRA